MLYRFFLQRLISKRGRYSGNGLYAARTLAELKGAGGLIPDQAIFINAIPLQEALLSSEIENVVTTQDALFKAALFLSIFSVTYTPLCMDIRWISARKMNM
ncbi:MAG: hypothetical protein HGA99_10845 [Chlorobiaceae bacterium]|jgi:hypothetical protein|nr:hypothetical protein [Chlorobiaceae bacterium]